MGQSGIVDEAEAMTTDVEAMPFEEFAADVAGVFDRVVREKLPITIERDDGSRVVLEPDHSPRTRADSSRRPSAEDAELSRQGIVKAAGGWEGLVDAEEFKAYIYERRRMPGRPSVRL